MDFKNFCLLFCVFTMSPKESLAEGDSDDNRDEINDLMKMYMSTISQCPSNSKLKHLQRTLENAQEILRDLESYKDYLMKVQEIKNTLAWISEETHKLNKEKLDYIKYDAYFTHQCQYQDCSQMKNSKPSGVYPIYPDLNETAVDVYCDMETDGGGWTVIQRRIDGTASFDRGWEDFEHGFGDKNGEYWLGNKYVHAITSTGNYELKVVLIDTTGKETHALYNNFSIGNSNSKYELSIWGYSGTAGDWMIQNNKKKFSTKDNDNDTGGGKCAAESNHGAWWHFTCSWSDLNVNYARKLRWYNYAFVKSVMMIRRL